MSHLPLLILFAILIGFVVLCFWIGARQDAKRARATIEPTEADRELVRRVQHWYNDNVITRGNLSVPVGEWHLECSPEHAARLVAQFRRDHAGGRTIRR